MFEPKKPTSSIVDVLDAEQARRKAILTRDFASLSRMFSTELTAICPQGKTYTKAEFLDIALTEPALSAIDSRDTTTRLYGDIAVVTGEVSTHTRTPDPSKTKVVMNRVLQIWKRESDLKWRLFRIHATAAPGSRA